MSKVELNEEDEDPGDRLPEFAVLLCIVSSPKSSISCPSFIICKVAKEWDVYREVAIGLNGVITCTYLECLLPGT